MWHEVQYSQVPCDATDAFPSGRTASRPILIVTLRSGTKQLSCYALVDSGADHSTFPLSFAHQLGLDRRDAKADASSGLGSRNVPAYFWPVTLDLQGLTQYPIYASFTEGLDHWGIGLLGQTGFFDRFAVTFVHSKGIFLIDI